MMKKDKTLKIAFSSALMLAVVAAGVSMYRSNNGEEEQAKQQVEEQQVTEDQLTEEQLIEEQLLEGEAEEEIPETADVTTNEAQAENTQNMGESTGSGQNAGVTSTPDAETTPESTPESGTEAAEESAAATDTSEQETTDTAAMAQPELNFSEDSTMLWPVSGEVLIDYSMDATTYFQTLDQYKCNSALILGSTVGEPVQAAANGQVLSITENEETGTTLTMDLGNGYQAIYGQLKDLTVSEGQSVSAGTIIGYVNDPTKYYVKEGANLYFAMRKDGEIIDPMIYIETVTE